MATCYPTSLMYLHYRYVHGPQSWNMVTCQVPCIYHVVLYCPVPCHISPYFTILTAHATPLHYLLLYYILYFTLLYYTVPYYTSFYYAGLDYTMLYCTTWILLSGTPRSQAATAPAAASARSAPTAARPARRGRRSETHRAKQGYSVTVE